MGTVIGHLVIGLVCAALAAGGLYLYGVHHERERDKAVVAACMTANAQDERVIEQLRQANDSYAQAAAVSKTELEHAAQAVAAQHAASVAALKATQTRLDKAIHDHQDATTWGAVRVPAAVADSLRQ